jgi:hypothetical protein
MRKEGSMEKAEIMEKVIEAVRQVQELSGRPVGNIGRRTCPIRDVEGFDSLSGIEATVILSESLKQDLPEEYNAFISKDGRRALSVIEITENLCEIIGVETKRK